MSAGYHILAVATILSLILAAFAALSHRAPRWLPVPLAIGLLLATFGAWDLLAPYDGDQLDNIWRLLSATIATGAPFVAVALGQESARRIMRDAKISASARGPAAD